jgi:hypothetical protein
VLWYATSRKLAAERKYDRGERMKSVISWK